MSELEHIKELESMPQHSGGTMSLKEHLVELRNRIAISVIAIFIGSIAGWFFYEPVMREITQPLIDIGNERDTATAPNFGSVVAAFDYKVKISAVLGVFISSPMWIYQIGAFIMPGLTKKEKFYVLGFVSAGIPLFLSGGYLAFTFIPNAVSFLVNFAPDNYTLITDAPLYLTFVMQIVLTFALSFLLPVVLVALNFLGLLSARQMLKGWRWGVVVSFTFAAIATPTPEVISMFLLALPLIGLYFAAVGVAAVNDRVKSRKRKPFDDLDDDIASPL